MTPQEYQQYEWRQIDGALFSHGIGRPSVHQTQGGAILKIVWSSRRDDDCWPFARRRRVFPKRHCALRLKRFHFCNIRVRAYRIYSNRPHVIAIPEPLIFPTLEKAMVKFRELGLDQ